VTVGESIISGLGRREGYSGNNECTFTSEASTALVK